MQSKKMIWTAIATGAAALATLGIHQSLNQAWKLATADDPPENPASSDVTWRDAITWTLATGTVVALARLLALRGAAAGWKQFTGEKPPL